MEGKGRGGRGRRIRRRERIYASENSLIGCVRVLYMCVQECAWTRVRTTRVIEASERIEKKEKKKKAKTRN